MGKKILDKKGSPLKVFSFVHNVIDIIEKKKNMSFTKTRHPNHYNRQKDLIKKYCFRIYNDIENSYYSYKDLTIATLSLYYNHEIFKYNSYKYLTDKYINIIKDKFSTEQYSKDKKFIENLNKNKGISFKKNEDFFILREGGQSIIYDLIKKQYISPIFFIKLLNKFKFETKLMSKDYIRFERITKKIKEVIEEKGDKYA